MSKPIVCGWCTGQGSGHEVSQRMGFHSGSTGHVIPKHLILDCGLCLACKLDLQEKPKKKKKLIIVENNSDDEYFSAEE